MEICPKCGLPREACVCEEIAKTEQRTQVFTKKRRYGKIVTLVSGIEDSSIDIKEIAKKLKQELACGGTIKNKIIELQGNHEKKAKGLLIKLGFNIGESQQKNEK
jgi:translation initiation factor 1